MPTLETGIELLPRQIPFLRDLATVSRELRPGVTDLRATLPVLNDAIEVGTPVLARSVGTSKKLEKVLRELNQLVSQPATRITLERLEQTFEAAKPLVKWVVPQQTVCNYWNYWFTFVPNGALRARRDRLHVPPGPDELPALGRGDDADRRLLRPAVERPRRRAPRRHVRALHAADPQRPPLRPGRPPRRRLPGRPVRLRPRPAALVPGQAADNPAYGVSDLPGSRGPTTLFCNAERNRTFLDTRNPARAPEGWQDIK